MPMAAPSLDHLARLDIAHLVSPSVTIKSTKAPFPDVRERATVRLLATAGRSLSHRVLERELSLQQEPYPSIAKFRYIHRTLSHMSQPVRNEGDEDRGCLEGSQPQEESCLKERKAGAAEGEGLRILTDGYTDLLQRLDPQESLVVTKNPDSALPTEWIDLYAKAYLKLEPLGHRRRGTIEARYSSRSVLSYAGCRLGRAQISSSPAYVGALMNRLGEESVGGPSATALEDNPVPSASSPRSAVEEVRSATSLTRPTSVSSLLSSESVVDLPEGTPSVAEVSSLNYSATEHGSPRLRWGGPVKDERLDEPAGDVERCHGGGSAEGRRPSKTRGHFRPRVLVPPVRPYPVSEEEAKSEEGLQAMPSMEAPPSEASGDEPVESPIVKDSDEIVDTELRSALPSTTKSCDPPVEPTPIVEDSTRSRRGRRRPVNGIKHALRILLDDSDAGRRIEAKVAESRSKVDPGRTQFMSELRAKVAQMQQRMDALRSSPAGVDPGTSCLEETVARSLVWDGMDPVEARMLARKVDKAGVSRVLERLATHSSDLTGAKGEVQKLQKLASRQQLERDLQGRTDTVVGRGQN
ncbi:hypothetical protein FOZ60_010027 [Perkinsus olseni]|uniref:Uncharacterized protein n=1 Tax=Perkinsus olseni TaxID=32597 RepID=A0A7J6NGB0_PEROL|nr:hypothetical protein FOZ60_010027 [Perkinsus olseni]